MTTKTHLLSIFAIATILLTSTIVPNFVAYADNDTKKCIKQLEDFIKDVNKLIDEGKLSAQQGQSLISTAEGLIVNDCGSVNEILLLVDDVGSLFESDDLTAKDANTLIKELKDAISKIGKLTKLQKECLKLPNKPEKVNDTCELLNIINALQEDQAGNIANLNLKIKILSAAMQMDDTVCDNIPNADKVSDTTLGQLCDQADVWIANYEALCNNVPFFKDGIELVDTTTVSLLTGINTDFIGKVNIAINTLKGFSTSFSLNIPDINISLGSISLPLDLGSINLGRIDIPLPTINFQGITPFSSLPIIPNIPGSVISDVGSAINSIENCSV